MQFTCLKEKNEKKYFSSHKLPNQQSTSFWSQGILGVKPNSKWRNSYLNELYGNFWELCNTTSHNFLKTTSLKWTRSKF
jgi:hypothetical protein